MSPGVTLSIHLWRGWGSDAQKALFVVRIRLGFVTLAVERTDVLTAYRKLRSAIERAVERAEMEGR